jgi:hypothetical protein
MKSHVNLTKLSIFLSLALSVSTAFSAEIFGIKLPGTKQQTMPIPDVTHHELGVSTSEIQNICEKRVEEEMPCVVVHQGNKICYAYMDLKGVSEQVHCFIRTEEMYAAD